MKTHFSFFAYREYKNWALAFSITYYGTDLQLGPFRFAVFWNLPF